MGYARRQGCSRGCDEQRKGTGMVTVGRNIAAKKLNVDSGDEGIRVHIPPLHSNERYIEILEQLLKLSSELAPRTWTIDLSELDGIPVGLASILVGFGQEARHRGCEVKFTGIRASFAPDDVNQTQGMQYFGLAVA